MRQEIFFEYQLSSTAQGTANDLMAALMVYYGFSVTVSNALKNVFLVGAGGMILCVLVTLLSEKKLKTA